MEKNKIFNQLKKLHSVSYAKYSNYPVSAIVSTDKGNFEGVNVENGAFPLGICAEVNAISTAVTNGATKVKEVFLLTKTEKGFGTPCGGCRQFIFEFSENEDVKINLYNLNEELDIVKIKDLLPYPWKDL